MKAILLSIFLCIGMQLFGQFSPLVDFPSPNAASLGVYGQIPVDHFTGIPDISIPIHTVQLKEIQLPITLRYHLASVKPDATPGWTGLGWALAAGGSITRIIKGKKDEMTKYEVSLMSIYTPGENVGYYYRSSELVNNANWTDNSFLLKYSNPVQYYTDLEPDEFMFNFAGMSGSFYYNGEPQQFKIKSKQPLSLKISLNITANTELEVFKKLPTYYPTSSRSLPLRNYISKFTIVDSNGIIYEFGGNTNAIDFTTSPVSVGSSVNTFTTAVTWYLTAITTPNGEKIQFNYKKEGDFFINSRARSKMVEYYTYSNNTNNGRTISDIPASLDEYFAIHHLSYLESIITPIETIAFESSPSNELTYNYNNFGSSAGNFGGIGATNTVLREYLDNRCLNKERGNYKLKLDQISISNKTENIKNFNFTYLNSASQRLQLGELKTTDYKYQFVYNPNNLPEYNSKKTDHWGFYNEKYYGDKGYSTLAGFRTPNENSMKAETLEKIIYPTGGVTIFEYEAHDYSKVATLYSDWVHLFSLKNESGTAGGLRIRKVISKPDTTSNNGQVVKEYFYRNPDNTSSGILSGKPIYDMVLSSDLNNSNSSWFENLCYRLLWPFPSQAVPSVNCITLVASSENHMNPLGNTNGSHITYSRITEKYTDGSSSIYCYTNQDDQGDEFPAKALVNIQHASAFIEPFTSKEIGRGLLKTETHKNAQGITVDSTEYQYEYNYNDYVKSVAINRQGSFDEFICTKHYTFVPKLIEKKEIRYDADGNNPVATHINNQYNSRNLLAETSLLRSDGKQQITQYTYPFEIKQGPDTAVLRKMTEKNILSHYIEKVTSLNRGYVIEGEYRKFGETNSNSGVYAPFRIDILPTGSKNLSDLYSIHTENRNLSLESGFDPPNIIYKTETFTIQYNNPVKVNISMNFGQVKGFVPYFPVPVTFIFSIEKSTGQLVYNVEANDFIYGHNSQYGYEYSRSDEITLTPGTYTAKLTHRGRWSDFSNLNIGHVGSCNISFAETAPTMASVYSFLEPEIYYQYNNFGNIIEARQAGSNVATTYLWSYNSQYPVAEIKNVTYEQVKTILSETLISRVANAITPSLSDLDAINNLRTNSNLSKIMLTTYTYKPLVGMTSATDPRGVTVYYEYDDFGRLKTIKDNNGNIIEKYDYHYKN